jgi:hypothetical protein
MLSPALDGMVSATAVAGRSASIALGRAVEAVSRPGVRAVVPFGGPGPLIPTLAAAWRAGRLPALRVTTGSRSVDWGPAVDAAARRDVNNPAHPLSRLFAYRPGLDRAALGLVAADVLDTRLFALDELTEFCGCGTGQAAADARWRRYVLGESYGTDDALVRELAKMIGAGSGPSQTTVAMARRVFGLVAGAWRGDE